jgi:Abnormal spindle-like microcephaly-assoc'd, ASPM-SPD-2-Hydin
MADVITLVNIIPNLSSGETNQDSEPNLAVNPANPLELAATAFTPSPNSGSKNSPIFYSSDGGLTWSLKDIIAGTPVRDQTLRFATQSGILYAGVLWGGGSNIALINFDILRTSDFSGLTTMTQLAQRKNDDQPFVQAASVPSGPDAGKDRIYVGSNDHAPANVPATVDLSLDAAAPVPATATFVIESRAVLRDGFQTRPAVHPNGTVYALYYARIAAASFDVVIVRDDNWASGATPFNALVDGGDATRGVRIATGVDNPFLSLFLGQQRIGGDLSIAVDPNDSTTVYVCWGDRQGGTYTLYVRKSTDSGATWSSDLRAVTNATNPALAINSVGRLGLLYQQVTGIAPNQSWHTTLELTTNDFASITTYLLANTPAGTPGKTFDPYLGDYLYMMAVGTSFYGIFSASNTPDHANFPNGVSYQRNANFGTKTLLAADNVTPVAVSIDPFVFKVMPGVGRVVTAIANAGNFGHVCLGSFVDEELTIDNSGTGPLSITNITSSSPDFLPPSVLSYPITLEVGDAIDVAIRFAPLSLGAKSATITVFSDDPAGPHTVQVSGLAPAPRLSLIIANSGNFGNVCLGSFADELLTINNSGTCPLSIFNITGSADFLAPSALSYPLLVGPGESIDVAIRFQPLAPYGAKAGAITILSNDPAGPHVVPVSGVVPAPKANLIIANTGSFGDVCVGSFADEPLIVTNSGKCTLSVTGISSTSGEFLVPEVLSYPITVGPGDALPVPIRFKPLGFGAKAATITVTSDDPASPISINVSGDAPAGKLTVAGSTTFGGVNAGCCADRTLSICNTGECALGVTSVRFRRRSRRWKLLNNPFPAKLRPGSCLPVVIQYRANEKCPRPCELVIESDDPVTPVKYVEVLAYTIWDACCKEGSDGCRKEDCDDCRKGCCDKHPPCRQGYPCCDDDDDDDDDGR